MEERKWGGGTGLAGTVIMAMVLCRSYATTRVLGRESVSSCLSFLLSGRILFVVVDGDNRESGVG